jgi:hypothetical protein
MILFRINMGDQYFCKTEILIYKYLILTLLKQILWQMVGQFIYKITIKTYF